ncbi:MAG: hypothetical protein LBV75_08445 [Paludibacter sp.]|nr:hypothetical protein [Paludibacter sp.]
MKNFAKDSVSFVFESDKHIKDTVFVINHYDMLSEDFFYNGKLIISYASILDSVVSCRIEAIKTNTQNYFMSIAIKDTTKLTNYDSVKIDNTYEKYYFCGKLSLQKNIESYVFLTQKEYRKNNTVEIGDQSLWLFNVRDNIVTSVSELFYKSQGIETVFYQETFRENNIFVHFSNENRKTIKKRFFGNKTLKKTKEALKNIDCILYKVNEDGYIEIIGNPPCLP